MCEKDVLSVSFHTQFRSQALNGKQWSIRNLTCSQRFYGVTIVGCDQNDS